MMLVLYTDFGQGSYYAGQMEVVCRTMAPAVPCVVLTHNAPRCDPRAASILLAALVATMPRGAVFVCVVDPGVGGARRPLVVRGNGCWFVGPDNGLMLAAAGPDAECFRLDWRPAQLSDTFHGRDLFAPAAAKLALGEGLAMSPASNPVGEDWSQQLAQVIDIDRFGNLITGLQAERMPDSATVRLAGAQAGYARCFSDVAPDRLFWYRNSLGLVEIAANGSSAAVRLQVRCGETIEVVNGDLNHDK